MSVLTQLNSALSGRYTIEREIGAGGMATVYLARDVRHERNVALKLLNPELGAVLGVERFLSEIRVTANLQHPNLLPLFDSGAADGLLFYVMPFVEGESLRAKLAREKQLPVDEAVRIATAVASALDYAHSHGVIHRDLKPENILIQAGQPVVADFGIALAVTNAGGNRITQSGLSLGTPQYMSPEQATGDRAIDGRTDIYSLGAVLYEMLIGDPPYLGGTAQAVIAKVLTERPASVRAARATVPEYVDEAVARALEKLPADRFATAREFGDALQGKTTGYAASPLAARRAQATPIRRALPWISMAVTAAAGFFAARALSRGSDEAAPTVRFAFVAPEGTHLSGSVPAFAISPDGRSIAFNTLDSSGQRVMQLRRIDQLQSRTLPGIAGATFPTFSFDGKWIAFTEGGKLLKIALDGGAPIPLADLPGAAFGLDWGPDDEIIVGSDGGLLSVPALGGAPKRLSTPDTAHGERGQRWPRVLPDGKAIAYTSWRFTTAASKLAIAWRDGHTKVLDLAGTAPLGVMDGDLVYGSATGQILAVPFDLRAERPTGTPVPVVDQVLVGGNGAMSAALGRDGSLMYGIGIAASQLVLADQHNATHAAIEGARTYSFPRFSPDGKRIAVSIAGQLGTDVWIFDLASRTLDKLTTEGANNARPEWSPDGRTILFTCGVAGRTGLCTQPANGSGRATLVVTDAAEGAFTPDGRTIVFRRGAQQDLFYRALAGDTTPKPIVVSPAIKYAPRASPDGRWVAYSSNESGTPQVYVRPFPALGARYQVSVNGGAEPVWSRDGRRLFYSASGRNIMAATFSTANAFAVTKRDTAFSGDRSSPNVHANYDVAPDGTHLLLVVPITGAQWVVAHNWRAELRARMGKPGR